MRFESSDPVIPPTVAAGDPVRTRELTDVYVYLDGTDFDGVVAIDVSPDGATWLQLATETFDGSPRQAIVAIDVTAHSVRLRTATANSGTVPWAIVTGRNVLTL